jgi:hypothetical protein
MRLPGAAALKGTGAYRWTLLLIVAAIAATIALAIAVS